MVLNSLSFCFSVKLLISPSYLNENFAGYSNLGYSLFSFITLGMSCHSLLACIVSIERSAAILTGIPLCVICCFSLAAFNICSLCLIFVNLINMCLGVFQCKEIEENNRMGKTRDLFKKIRDTKRTFHAKMGSIKDRNGLDLTEAEDIKKRWQEYTEELYKKVHYDPDNYDGVITHLEPDILECKVKWA